MDAPIIFFPFDLFGDSSWGRIIPEVTFVCSCQSHFVIFDHDLCWEVLKVTILLFFLGIQTIYFLGREVAKKGPLGSARGQASNAIWPFSKVWREKNPENTTKSWLQERFSQIQNVKSFGIVLKNIK